VIELRPYAADGATLITDGLSLTLSALDAVLRATDAGFDIARLTPAAPKLLPTPTTTTTVVPDATVHDDAAAPDAGVAPMRALQF